MQRTLANRRIGILLLLVAVAGLLVACTQPTMDTSPEWIGYYNGKSTSGDYAIGICTADDVEDGFVRDSVHSPVRPPTGYTHIAAPCIIVAEGTFYMYVEGYSEASDSWQDVLLLTSPDGLHWTYHSENPVLTRVGGVRRCNVLYEPEDEDQPFKMWYVRSDSLDIAYAWSRDGVTWSTDDVPVLTAGLPGSWDDDHVMVGGVCVEDGSYVLFYAGHDGQYYQGGYATSPAASGPFTKSSDNPIIRRRADGDAAVLEDLEAHTKLVAVADPSAFELGEPVVLCSSAGAWEVNRIAATASPTHVELAQRTVQQYDVADGARIRSWASQDVQSTCVWRSDGQWNVVTCNFGFHKAVMGTINFMVEVTGYMTGPSLSDLSWSHAASPLLPMTDSLDTVWDQCSRENLWVKEL